MTYNLVRSQRKTLAIYIKPGGVVEVRAPLRCPVREIERFVASKQQWIAEKQALVRAREATRPVIDPATEIRCRARAKEILPQRVAHFADLMELSPTQVKVSSAKSRWGSCSSKGSLNFSWRLMLAGDEVIDYVVVHELAHLREMNHSPRFWAVVEQAMPDYQRRKKLLKEFQGGMTTN